MSNQDLDGLPSLKINVPSFLLKTYEILENAHLSNVIGWNAEGNAFIVYNSSELAQKVLANYFKHKNYPSFLRQLNMYNFKKTKNQFGQSEFRHKWFRRGLKYVQYYVRSMLQYIRRRNQEESENKIETKEKDNELDYYKKDHEEMKGLLKDLVANQEKMQSDFGATIEQNQISQRHNQGVFQCIQHLQTGFNKKFDQISMLLAKIVSSVPSLQGQLGEILKLSLVSDEHVQFDYRQPEQSQLMPYGQSEQYSNFGSPFPSYIYGNSPVHMLFQRQRSCKNYFNEEMPEYCFQFDPNIFMINRNAPSLALPPIPPSYLPSNNYSLQSSVSNSPYRIPNPAHSSTTESKSVDKFSLYQNA